MITQLATVKARLGISEFDVKDDAILTNAIKAVTVRFDKECNRTLARAVGLTQQFGADETEIAACCYPVESVTGFELKTSEAGGWVEQTDVEFLIRRQCIISLSCPINYQPSTINHPLARVTYTGGYVLPGSADILSATRLPDDLEQAAVEQVAYWYANRNRLGVIREWPKGGVYLQFQDLDLLPSVRAVLKHYERWTL
jgi:hypothetical protein